ncbi:MAG: NUDIX domain-containing protein [Candidatus Thiodiazotropha sp. (ex Myrtea sp. 'scaly one' KF741663)]|nr:NUDIX domain-containing protein [Candidatus Thiodiazotropha sp. (ex Myrtea sp. 'scaly one' KF741663)]
MNDLSSLEGLEPQIRNAVRAVVVREGAVLMQKKWAEARGTWYTMPGGGQDVQETMEAALIRECEEEIGTRVQVGALLSVADFFKQRDKTFPSVRHVIEFYFACEVADDYQPASGPHPDKHQVDVVWLPITELSKVALFPKDLARHLPSLINEGAQGYLGVID